MQTFIIFLIIFFLILILIYPLLRIIYFFISKKTIQNKILSLCIMIISYVGVYFGIRNFISNLLSLNFGDYINSIKEFVILGAAIIIGSFIETIINSIINFFIKRRTKSR